MYVQYGFIYVLVNFIYPSDFYGCSRSLYVYRFRRFVSMVPSNVYGGFVGEPRFCCNLGRDTCPFCNVLTCKQIHQELYVINNQVARKFIFK